MSQGRSSATPAAAIAIAVLCLLATADLATAAVYTVGGASGWTFNTVNWPKGKTFKAGDVLVFKYNPSFHNVVTVNKAGYTSCRTPAGAKVLKSGSDGIKLVKGPNYFICNFPGHCESNMKIAVNAV